jgi:hypothetical protein
MSNDNRMTATESPQNKFRLRWHEKSCANCRYFRIHTTGASCSECLFLGRSLGCASAGDTSVLLGWARERLCDGWKRRPSNWDEVSDKNPYWEDRYITRESLVRIRSRAGLEVFHG